MAGPYSGASIAADVLSRSISDMFKGLVQGQDRAAQVELQQEELGRSRRGEAVQQAFMPQQWQKNALDISGAQQAQDQSALLFPRQLQATDLQIASGQEDLSHRQLMNPIERGLKGQEYGFNEKANPLKIGALEYGNDLLQANIATERVRPKLMQAEMAATEMRIKQMEQEIAFNKEANPLILQEKRVAIANLRQELKHKSDLYNNYVQARAQLPVAIEALAHAAGTGNIKTGMEALARYGGVFIDSGMAQHPSFRAFLQYIDSSLGGGSSSTLSRVEDDARALSQQMIRAVIGKDGIQQPFTSEELNASGWIRKYAFTQVLRRMTGSEKYGETDYTVPPMPKYIRERLNNPDTRGWWESLMPKALGGKDKPTGGYTPEQINAADKWIRQGYEIPDAIERGAQVPETPAPVPQAPGAAPAPVAPTVPAPQSQAPAQQGQAQLMLQQLDKVAMARFGRPYLSLDDATRKQIFREAGLGQ